MFFNPNPSFDERQWIINIRHTLENELENDDEITICIFNVPKPLMSSDPALYTPQEVAIGPYHYRRSELYEMERQKLAAARRAQKRLPGHHTFEYVVDRLGGMEVKIRACYHKYLSFSNETLAWMMAIDASFLLEFLQVYAMRDGAKASLSSVLRDVLMLENQIPLFVLRKLLELQHSSLELADETLQALLVGFCQEITPFKTKKDKPLLQVSECSHLLDYLYKTMVPKPEHNAETTEPDDQGRTAQPEETLSDQSNNSFSRLLKLLEKLFRGPIRLIKKLAMSKQMKLVLSRIPRFPKPIGSSVFPQDNEEKKSDDPEESKHMNKPPLVEEIAIPSVTDLAKTDVRFSASIGDISTVSFDTKKAVFHLPTISLDVNTEVILRNLVAYEASLASGPLVVTRYTELMNGIIDTEEDAMLLREKGVIVNRLKSDAEVARMWNGMNRSIKLTKVPHLDRVIADVNKYYDQRWKVKIGKYMKRYVFGSWQFLTLLAAVVLLILTTLQSFCSVYNCRKWSLGGSNSD